MRTVEVIRAEMRSVNDQLNAKVAQLDGATEGQILELKQQHDDLIRRWDTLVGEERATQAEARSAYLAAPAPSYGTGARASTHLGAQRKEGIENAILNRSNSHRYELTEAGRQYRGMTLAEIGREVLEEEGVAVRGMSKSEIATRSLMTTSDFPNILAGVTNKTLRDSYAAAPRTFLPIARELQLKDFKLAHRVQLGAAPTLLPLNEQGEYKRGVMNEGAETIQLNTFGRIVGITRNIIINDDVGAFTHVPEMFGTQAANLESDIVWALVLSNPVLATDQTPVYSAAHHNLGTGAASALQQGNPPVTTAAGIAAGRVALSKQVDIDGVTVLNLKPKLIAVPPELETPIQQVLFGITPNTSGAVVPDSIKSLQAISEPRLSSGARGVAGSTTAWYMFADPAAAETLCYAYLDGQTGPYTETRPGFDIDGIEVKCRHDFGAAFTDFDEPPAPRASTPWPDHEQGEPFLPAQAPTRTRRRA